MTITIKPHHLLDVYKLYGKGIYPFSPDMAFEHDFYLIGNLLLNHKVDSIVLTTGSDDICKPCKYHDTGICIDALQIGEFMKKNDYNYFIDQNLLRHLHLSENTLYALDTLLSLFVERASLLIFSNVWCFNDMDNNELRFSDTLTGIRKYMLQE